MQSDSKQKISHWKWYHDWYDIHNHHQFDYIDKSNWSFPHFTLDSTKPCTWTQKITSLATLITPPSLFQKKSGPLGQPHHDANRRGGPLCDGGFCVWKTSFLQWLSEASSRLGLWTVSCWIKVLIFICIFSTVRLCWRSLKLFFLDCHAADKLLKLIWMMLKYKVHQSHFSIFTLQLVVWRSNLSIKSTTVV